MKKNAVVFTIILSLFTLFFISCENPALIDLTGLYKVSFETNGGNAIETYRTCRIEESPVTQKTDSIFCGWYESSDFTDAEVSFPFELTEDTILYAKWIRPYNVKFETNGGTSIANQKTDLIEIMPKSTKTGYILYGWYTDEDFLNLITFPYKLESDIVLYAKWEADNNTKYTVEHYQQNADLISYSLVDAQVMKGKTDEQTAAIQKNITGFHAKEFSQGTISADGSCVVKIYYDRNKFSVRYNANGGKGSMSIQEFYYNVPQKLYENTFTKDGYSFDGWASSSSGTVIYSDANEVQNLSFTNGAVINLYAKWFYGTVTTANLISELNLSTLTDDYTLKIKGSISNSYLLTIAEKIEKASCQITLDLSETQGITEINGTGDTWDSIFSKCKKLEKLILPNSLKTIGNAAFQYCYFSSILIPDSVTVIGTKAFLGCVNLSNVQLSENLTTIGEWAFNLCNSLTTITIPKSVTSIGPCAFYDLESLSSVIFEDNRSWTCAHQDAYIASHGYTYKVSVSNPASNAAMLKAEYFNYIWTKN